MDYLDTCNICTKKITHRENVVLTADGLCEQEPADEMPAEYSVDEWSPYRGVYCLSCWDKMCGQMFKLQDKHAKEANDE